MKTGLVHISDTLRELRLHGRKALSLFITAGYPTIGSTVPLAAALAAAGADLIELGIPFSDPIADGPTIQQSSEAALRNGVTVRKTFEMAKEIRKQTDIPLILMGYANPLYAYGVEKFLRTCQDIGIDGTIVPDLPLEESEEYRTIASKSGIATIFLAAPTTPPGRLALLDAASTGFLYCVSVTGVTGMNGSRGGPADTFLKDARAIVKSNPFLVGFGIATADDARRIAMLSDGVIVGSALIKILQSTPHYDAVDAAVRFAKTLRAALA